MSDKELTSHLPQRTFRSVKWKREQLGFHRKPCGTKHNINEVRTLFKERGYELLEENYISYSTKMKYICNKHRDKGIQEIDLRHFSHGRGCYFCGRERTLQAKMHPDQYYIDICNELNFTYVGRYVNGLTIIQFYCNNHKDKGVQEKSITSLEKRTGCIYCNNFRTERQLEQLLSKMNLHYICQKRFEECKDRYTLPFDFYLSDYNVLIEYDGEQHYIPIDFAGKGKEWAENNLKKNQRRDKIKTEFCKMNNIPLIRIPYYERDNMESFLLTKLKEYNIEIT